MNKFTVQENAVRNAILANKKQNGNRSYNDPITIKRWIEDTLYESEVCQTVQNSILAQAYKWIEAGELRQDLAELIKTSFPISVKSIKFNY